MKPLLEAFDADFTLAHLLTGINVEQLLAQLSSLAGSEVQLLDEASNWLAGAEHLDSPRCLPLVYELEPVGYLAVSEEVSQPQQAALQGLVQAFLRSTSRYLMASSLHLEAIKEDYKLLQQQNAELVESRQAYKTLADQLELRVQQQVQLLEQNQRKLYQAERRASVGQLAAGMAHEINNPLGFIKSNLGNACRYLDKVEGMLKLLKAEPQSKALMDYWQASDMDFILEDFSPLMVDSLQGVERVAVIVKTLREFSAIDRAEQEQVDLNTIITNVLEIMRQQTPEGVVVQSDLQVLPSMLCQPAHISQMLLNIVKNGVQACESQGCVTVSSRARNKTLEIEISDDGVGITEQQLPHIFDPFFTTKGVGGGIGLGLSMALDIVAAHEGEIEVSARPDKGTIFTITLPLREL